MLMRFLGILIVIAAAVLIYVAIDGLVRTNEMARTLAGLAAAKAERFDSKDWAWHWRLSSLILLTFGAAALVAGIGIVKRHRWGLLLWSSLMTVVFGARVLTALLRVAAYAFEETTWLEIVGTGAIGVVSWLAAWSTKNGAAFRSDI